ncbi:hypothetical protein DFH27DRAFT_119086 [Peziza echinospora]|nr:hypothetical protein DFH27DRAFT_119086 [Peziza echinospora]
MAMCECDGKTALNGEASVGPEGKCADTPDTLDNHGNYFIPQRTHPSHHTHSHLQTHTHLHIHTHTHAYAPGKLAHRLGYARRALPSRSAAILPGSFGRLVGRSACVLAGSLFIWASNGGLVRYAGRCHPLACWTTVGHSEGAKLRAPNVCYGTTISVLRCCWKAGLLMYRCLAAGSIGSDAVRGYQGGRGEGRGAPKQSIIK